MPQKLKNTFPSPLSLSSLKRKREEGGGIRRELMQREKNSCTKIYFYLFYLKNKAFFVLNIFDKMMWINK